MKPIDQTIFSTTEFPDKGNCLSAVVASLLEVPLEEIPYFAENWEDWWSKLNTVLWEHGYVLHGTIYRHYNRVPPAIPETEDEFWDRVAQSQCCSNGVDGYFIVAGGSPRGWKNGHAVIYKDRKLAHDPHPSKSGITEIWYAYKITKKDDDVLRDYKYSHEQ